MSGNAPSSAERDTFRIVRAIRDLFEGRRNTTGTVTLTAGATSTVVTHVNFGADSVPVFTATTSNAATIDVATMRVTARTNGTFTITHANNAAVDRTFLYSFDG